MGRAATGRSTSPEIEPDDTLSFTVRLRRPGRYLLICLQPGHAEKGRRRTSRSVTAALDSPPRGDRRLGDMTDITTIPTTEPELVEVPETLFLAVDGQGPASGAALRRGGRRDRVRR